MELNSFDKIYENNIWGSSGSGSRYTRDNIKYIKYLNDMIKEKNIKNVCDFGCGDFEIMQHLDFKGINYTGVDLVKSVIDNNNDKFKKENINFKINKDIINKYDLVVIKDVLQHHEDNYVQDLLNQLIDDNKYVLCINGFKFSRKPEKNNWITRDINNRYRYHPIVSLKQPLIGFKQYEINKYTHRCKEYILYEKK